jgi:hypothetical protein
MAVLITLLVMVMPAVSGFGRSTGLTTGGNMVTNLAGLARQEATSRNTMTALVLLRDQGTDADYRAFTVAVYDVETGWRQITAWEQLPVGIVVDRNTENDPNSELGSFVKNSPATFPLLSRANLQENPPVDYAGNRVRSFAVRIFLPNGSLMNAEEPAHLRIVEGFLQGNRTTYTHPGIGAAPANYYDIALIGATGVAKVDRP